MDFMTNYRTSLTSPLRIDTLDLGAGRGQIGMTICPGKRGASEYGAQWKRDLATDIAIIRAWGASTLLTLMESEEMRLLGIETIGEIAKKSSLHWYQLPIIDGSIPDNRFDTAWPHVGRTILNSLRSDEKIVVHCRGGLGRTGMIVSALLIEDGKDYGQARQTRHQLDVQGSGHPGRARLSAIQSGRRCLAVPPALETLRAYQRDHHHQPDVRGMVERVRGCQADHGPARPADASLPHCGNRQ